MNLHDKPLILFLETYFKEKIYEYLYLFAIGIFAELMVAFLSKYTNFLFIFHRKLHFLSIFVLLNS